LGRGSAVFPLQSLALPKNGIHAVFRLQVFASQKPGESIHAGIPAGFGPESLGQSPKLRKPKRYAFWFGVPAAALRAQDQRFFPGIMLIEQTIEVPADHRLLLELPAGIPRGIAKIALHITPLDPDPQKSKRVAFQSFM
jgi:hypothetical protein